MSDQPAKIKRTKVLDKRVGINSSSREAVEFAQKLAYDDTFRARFEKEPQEVLTEYHIYIPPEVLPEKVTLPPKEDIQAAIADVTLGGEFRPGAIAVPVLLVFLAFFAFYSK